MSDEDCYRRFNPCKAAREVARLAIAAFCDRVGGRSTLGWSKTRLCIARLGVSVDITRLQVPPRPPKRQSKDCLFFCQSILAKTVKIPDFLHESSQSGAFCISWAILTYLQLFLPILPNPVGAMATSEWEKNYIYSIRHNLVIHGCCMRKFWRFCVQYRKRFSQQKSQEAVP